MGNDLVVCAGSVKCQRVDRHLLRGLNEIGKIVLSKHRDKILRTSDESRPFSWEIISQIEHQRLRRLSSGGEHGRELLCRLRSERVSRLSCGVTDVQNNIGNGHIVEHSQGCQREGPGADSARAFERQKTLVFEIGFEHAAVVAGAAGYDHIRRAEIVDEAIVLTGRIAPVRVTSEQRRNAKCASLEAQRAVDTGVGPDDAWHRYPDALDSPHVEARTIEIVKPLRDGDGAGTGHLQRQQRQRIELAQGNVPGQLEFAFVAIVIGHLHPLDVEIERLTAQQPFMTGVPVIELDELGRIEFRPHQFPLHRLLCLTGDIEGEAIVLIVEAGDLA